MASLAFYLPSIMAAEISIPGDYSTIQAAIDAAQGGDAIIVQPGVYIENINFLGKAITIKSIDPNASDIVTSTIIDGNQVATVVTFNHGEDSKSVLCGITVRNGKEEYPAAEYSGIYCGFSSPTITKCFITTHGVGDGCPRGFVCQNSAPIIKNCIIRGGGIDCCSFASPIIVNCTIINNASLTCAGISSTYYSSPSVINSILWGNDSEIFADLESIPRLSYCDIQGGYQGTGNIDDAPLFVDQDNGDYHLKNGSPCQDAGHPRITDTDNSRSDIGSYGGRGGEPVAASIVVAIDGSGDFTSIQQAIDYVLSGDTINISPGTYRENLVIAGKSVSLIGQGGAGSVIIDGSRAGSVIVYINTKSDARLDGMTIQNGVSSLRDGGGGINFTNSSLTVTNCTIKNNSSPEYGGGIICDEASSPQIINCTITENFARISGGGISCNSSSPTVTDCTITNNFTTGELNTYYGTGGGGIYLTNSSPTITGCSITANRTFTMGGGISCCGPYCSQGIIRNCNISDNEAYCGGGIYCYADFLNIINCTMTGNSARSGGGAICCIWPITAMNPDWNIINCVIARNSATFGGGIFCSSHPSLWSPELNYPSPNITNCTITANRARLSGGGIFSHAASPIVTNCILWQNLPNQVDPRGQKIYPVSIITHIPLSPLYSYTDPYPIITYSDVQGGYRGEGNINRVPLFVGPVKGDYHLQSGSPCIDAGVDPNIPEAEMDRDRGARPHDGNNDGVANYDMGAYEYDSAHDINDINNDYDAYDSTNNTNDTNNTIDQNSTGILPPGEGRQREIRFTLPRNRITYY